jgi:predicted nicotinamide N-methyase
MAVTVTWSIEAHKKETSGNNYVGNVAWRCTASENDDSGYVNGNIILDRPSTVTAYATFMGSGDSNLVAAVKAQMGSSTVTTHETNAKAELAKVATPTHEWVHGPA